MRLITVFLLLAMSGSLFADSLDDVRQRLKDGRLTRVVCFGDSITGVYYHSGGVRAWPDMLELVLQRARPHARLQMINAGISGHTTVDALQRLEKDVLAHQPHLVVVKFGMNDITRVVSADYRQNLTTIVERCQNAGAAVVLCTPNSITDNASRTNARLAEVSQIVRELGDSRQIPVVDFFAAWQQQHQQDPLAWSLLMSDDIHPNLNGHVRFAETIGAAVCEQDTPMFVGPTPYDSLLHTFDRLHQGQSLKLMAMPPFDTLLPQALKSIYPNADIEVVSWSTAGQSMSQLAGAAGAVKSQKAHLVVPAVPLDAAADSPQQFVRQYEQLLNRIQNFAGRPWDVVPVVSVAEDPLPEDQHQRRDIVRRIIAGKDMRPLQREENDSRPVKDVVAAWVRQQYQVWRGTRSHLPTHNGPLQIPAQSWPQRPGYRRVRITVHYPGGQQSNVNAQTGMMLTLHNWGGTDCIGTASPTQLADRLNVVAVCVNYLQSGPTDSINSPEPYDYGYLQATDALRALSCVRRGLKQAGLTWDDGRTYCTGGSGGGNVTLMCNKLAPCTFACSVDICGMKKLSDDIAYNLDGGSRLNARWSQDPDHPFYLSPGEQELRFVGNPRHLQVMKSLQPTTKLVIVHGRGDVVCPFADAEECVASLQAAELPLDVHFIGKQDIDGKVFTGIGHSLGNRTEIVIRTAGKYLLPDSADLRRREGPGDLDHDHQIRYPVTDGEFVVSYQDGIPTVWFASAQP